ncbi:MAG: catalase [Solirubrobacteraceae bacterium]
MPPRRTADQSAPKPKSPAGGSLSDGAQAQQDEFLTTAQGLRLPESDHSLKAGDRGPTLMEDFHLREKITHFDHERIPERVVHARGAAAHGVFESQRDGRIGHQGAVLG